MVIFHSYVKLPEATPTMETPILTIRIQQVPPLAPLLRAAVESLTQICSNKKGGAQKAVTSLLLLTPFTIV